jgi:hypothetical protein
MKTRRVVWQKNGPIESSKRNLGARESANPIYKGESELKVIMPMGLWRALPFDITPLANHLLDDQFEQWNPQMLHRKQGCQNSNQHHEQAIK